MKRRFARAFTLIEILLVVMILAITASLILPSLASAIAPSVDQVGALLDADLRRGRLNAMGSMQQTVLVVGRDRDRWWIQPTGTVSEDRAVASSLRVLGRGNLGAFDGHTLKVVLAGVDASAGDVVIATFDLEGNRNAGEIAVHLLGPDAVEPIARWTVRSERTRVVSR
jgi:prepilin-type N-terminal cleavage/methylation domain-containing protein